MKRSIFFLIISISTFSLGVFSSRVFSSRESYPLVSLEEISRNSEYYDGKTVEIVTYAHLFEIDDKTLVIGEPYEKPESFTYLDLKENSLNLYFLQKQLSENFSLNHYKRVKVKV